jgi:secondary thiamine-phosphate synthase enzyme
MQTVFTISTQGHGLYEMTDHAAAWVQSTGFLTLFVRHTSANLLIQENADPEVRKDLRAFFARLVPQATDPAMSYRTHTYEGPDDMLAHIKSALLPVSINIPVTAGRLALGIWQGIYLFEHRDAPKQREVVAHLQ